MWLHIVSLSLSLLFFAFLPTFLTFFQPSQLVVIVFFIVAKIDNIDAAEVVVEWCIEL